MTRRLTVEELEKRVKVLEKEAQARELEIGDTTRELASGMSEVFEALKRISAGDPSVRVPEASSLELVAKLKHLVNLTAEDLGEIVDLSHEFAIGLAEHFDVLLKVSEGDLSARVTGVSQVELLEALKVMTNQMIDSVSKEISQRKEAKAEILRKTEFLNLVLESLPHPFYVIDASDYKVTIANTAARQGVSLKDITCYALTHKADRPCGSSRHPCPLEAIKKTRRPVVVEHLHYDKDGQPRLVEVHGYPIFDGEGNVSQIIESSLDITERKLAEKALRASEEKYRTLFEYEPNALFVLELGTFKILDVNARGLASYGHEKEELVGKLFLDLGPTAYTDGVLSTPGEETSTLCSAYPKVQHRRKDGGLFYVDVYACRTKHSKEYGIIATTVDVTESMVKETQLIQASKMATLGEMATGVAHELNQPLSVIKTASSFLIKKVNNEEEIKPDILKTLAEEVDSYVDRASKIIAHMRQFGRKSEVDKHMVQVNQSLSKALELFSQQLKLRNIEVVVQLQDDLPPILADSNRLEQVFINLLINARDAIEEKWETPQHEGEARKISIETMLKEKMVIVELADTGPGVDKAILNKIFEPFFTTKKVGKGTGLGLSISYGIIKDYGGTIEAISRENKGTTFRISFPVCEGN